MSEASPEPAVVVDASAVLAMLEGEAGGDSVADAADRLWISAVNQSEVVAKLAERGADQERIEALLAATGAVVVPFDEALGYAAGMLRPATRSLGLSLGDRACLALGRQFGLPILTAERRWLDVDLGLDIRAIR